MNEPITFPIWAAATMVVAIVVATMLVRRLEAKRQLAVVVGLALLTASALAGPAVVRAIASWPDRPDAVAAGDAAEERRALESRRAELTARATMPGSPLACLGALASEPVESACEDSVFASAMSIAVAVSYAAAQLRLLADGVAYARRADPGYAASLTDLRLAAENDAYGIYAHVLATRDGCTPDRCDAFALLHDPSTLKVHLRQRRYTSAIAQHRERWGSGIAPPVMAAPSWPNTAATAFAATMALAPATPMSTPATQPPLPKARPTVTARAETPVAAPAAAEMPPTMASAAAESPPAAAPVRPVRSRGLVPPVASVVPDVDFPSASSIPAISIMAAEPKLTPPPASIAPPPPAGPQ